MASNIQLGALREDVQYVEPRFQVRVEGWPQFIDAVLLAHYGEEKALDYGNALAYLFHRFGPPNGACSAEKMLCRYILTTTMPGMMLVITPHPSNAADLTIHFLVPKEAYEGVAQHDRKPQEEWVFRAILEACEAGCPEWATAWMQTYNTLRQQKPELPEAISWEQTLATLLSEELALSEHSEHAKAFWEWRRQAIVTLEQKEGFPMLLNRDSFLSSWDDKDPLLPFAQAAIQTLKNLDRPVIVDGVPINIRGVTQGFSKAVACNKNAGTPLLPVAAEAPEQFSDFLKLADTLGNGDKQAGIKAALKALDT
ncbi:hypothetical protein ACYPKM_00720 [Pseudomonas aeruginosa]